MSSLLDGKLADALAKGFKGRLLKLTLRKVAVTGRDAHGDPVTTPTDYDAEGFPDDYNAMVRAVAGIPATDTKIVLIAGLTGAEPAIGDKVLFRSTWFQIRNVATDPARATFECQCFKVAS